MKAPFGRKGGKRLMYQELYNKAIELGASQFGLSDVINKRFYVIYNDRKINFGSRNGSTFIDHQDEMKRRNWYLRHSKIRDKTGEFVIYKKTSPSFWSANILW